MIESHLSRLREQIELQRKLCKRLEEISAWLSSTEEVSAEEFVRTMEAISMSERLEKYYTPEQLEALEHRRKELGEEKIRVAEAEWSELIERVRAEMEAGTDPADERVQRLTKRWMELVSEFTGGDPGIERSVGNMWQQEESIHGIDTGQMREMMEYISRAMAASKKPEYPAPQTAARTVEQFGRLFFGQRTCWFASFWEIRGMLESPEPTILIEG